jgi:hypothetical protein
MGQWFLLAVAASGRETIILRAAAVLVKSNESAGSITYRSGAVG